MNLTKEEEELSTQDQKLKETLDLLVERSFDENPEIQYNSLISIMKEMKTSTGTMTSIPKPLKFLRPRFEEMANFFENLNDSSTTSKNKELFAEILSCLAMTSNRNALKYKLQGDRSDISSWGHEYVKHISGEISESWDESIELKEMASTIVSYNMKHFQEPDAVDLLLEIGLLEEILPYIDEKNYLRVCTYLLACARYVPEPIDSKIYHLSLNIFLERKKYVDSMRVALRLGDRKEIQRVFDLCEDSTTRKQLCFLLGRELVVVETEKEELFEIMSNAFLSSHFTHLWNSLGLEEPKTPETIFKTGDAGTRLNRNIDSAKQNLGLTFVNGFTHAGFSHDTLMIDEDGWIFKHKHEDMISVVGSLGLVMLWNVDEGLTEIDKFIYANEETARAGALLAVGMINAGIRSEYDPALALLTGHEGKMAVGAASGLGMAYASSRRIDVREVLSEYIESENATVELIGQSALSLGMVFIGSGDEDSLNLLLKTLLEMDDGMLEDTNSRFIALGVGLIFLGLQDKVLPALEAAKTLGSKFGPYLQMTLKTLAYAFTGNVLQVQNLLHEIVNAEQDEEYLSVAVLGLPLIAMADDIGAQMVTRMFNHILQFGKPHARRAVPLALALLCASNPRIEIIDTISRLTHDSDKETSLSAILSLGITSAGTSNARVAKLLRQLAEYYSKEAEQLFLVRISQGLLYLGKGTISLSPQYSERFLFHRVALGGLLAVLHSSIDMKNTILGNLHYNLFWLVSSMFPRMLLTLNEELKPISVFARVGQAVDVVGQAGRPKTITGFQTYETPLLLSYGERAELAGEDWIAESILEGVAILKKKSD